jgi:hypothetical protein
VTRRTGGRIRPCSPTAMSASSSGALPESSACAGSSLVRSSALICFRPQTRMVVAGAPCGPMCKLSLGTTCRNARTFTGHFEMSFQSCVWCLNSISSSTAKIFFVHSQFVLMNTWSPATGRDVGWRHENMLAAAESRPRAIPITLSTLLSETRTLLDPVSSAD